MKYDQAAVGLSRIQARWLDYAVKLLNDTEHRVICERNEGAQGTPALDRSLRWPGYIGSEYESAPLRILCVGQVHHASEFYRTLGHLQPTLTKIAQLRQTYGEHASKLLSDLQRGYEAAITEWGPWTKFRKILSSQAVRTKYGDLGPASIAYVNFARCWQTLDTRPNCRNPMKACGAAYPLVDFANNIEAQAVLVMSAETTLAAVGFGKDRSRIRGSLFTFPGRPSDDALAAIASRL